ncbi:GNAT family N-acetyltransferase [Klebsiella quasipneumoniae]|uniref:GNAT family N-acetyltransferase n=1 Tax=Klebsiella quasipneumoniae TaxID=1463165 RepID=UPI001F2FD721|nr:GNAT family N-acetyltransferase [Klebsiella quasipneumoniae]
MTVIPVPAIECSITELCRILADSFDESLTPFALPPEMFASRFISEGLSLEDSFVWLVNDNPAAIAIITRRMDKARLAAFGVLPEYRSQGLAKQMLTPLFTSLKEKNLSSVRLEVMRENTRAIALYHALGFHVRRHLCKYRGDPQSRLEIPSGDMESRTVDDFLRTVWSAPDDDLPWLASPLPLLTIPCDILRDNEHAWCAVAEFMGQPQIRCLFVEPAYRYQGRAKTMLKKINARWPGIGTSAAIPETLAPLFTAAGYQAEPLCQFEMELTF